MRVVKVAQFGLGAIGLEALKQAAGVPWLEIVGAVDSDPTKYQHSLVELTGLGSLDGLSICPSLDELFQDVQPDVILHTASSRAADAFRQVRPALEVGLAVVSTCEELIFPALRAPDLAREIEVVCQHTRSRLVATGVNPGFAMDLLPVCLTGVCRRVEKIEIGRHVDAATRRRALQAKIGCAQDPEIFRAKLASGEAGHAGLRESAALVAHALGWTLDTLAMRAEPVVARQDFRTEHFVVRAGQVCGMEQRVVGVARGVEVVELTLEMALGVAAPRDVVNIRGRPGLALRIEGGIAGDDATIGALINMVPRLLAAAPGFHLCTELSLPFWTGGGK